MQKGIRFLLRRGEMISFIFLFPRTLCGEKQKQILSQRFGISEFQSQFYYAIVFRSYRWTKSLNPLTFLF